MKNKYKAPTVKKAFQILKAISHNANGLKISDLARDLNISKSTVHGITAALEEQGAVKRNPYTKCYTPGVTLFELGRSVYSRIDLKDLARPVLVALMEKIGETVFLGIKNRDHITVIDLVESLSDFKITAPIGSTIPLLAGAIGKAFLADMPLEEAKAIVSDQKLQQYTDHSITDPEIYLEKLKPVRKQQVATDDEEFISGVRAVAALIRNYDQMAPAIWTVGFKASLNDLKMKTAIREIRNAAKMIQHHIQNNTREKD
ncbi:IclR family transcriptional regulator [Thermodesulfobacteriota bacterium]